MELKVREDLKNEIIKKLSITLNLKLKKNLKNQKILNLSMNHFLN